MISRILIYGSVGVLAWAAFMVVLIFTVDVLSEPEPYCTMWEEC